MLTGQAAGTAAALAARAGGNVAEVDVGGLQATLQQAGVRLIRRIGTVDTPDAATSFGEVTTR
jgi:hypothetical protein